MESHKEKHTDQYNNKPFKMIRIIIAAKVYLELTVYCTCNIMSTLPNFLSRKSLILHTMPGAKYTWINLLKWVSYIVISRNNGDQVKAMNRGGKEGVLGEGCEHEGSGASDNGWETAVDTSW